MARVFDSSCKEHVSFRPVLEWVLSGKGKFVYGGTTYEKELPPRYIALLKEFGTGGRTKIIPKDAVDQYETKLRDKIRDKDFDDPHLIAMVAVSACNLICTTEKRAIPYLKETSNYPKHVSPPSLYTSAANTDLLCDKYISDFCKPLTKGTKSFRDAIGL